MTRHRQLPDGLVLELDGQVLSTRTDAVEEFLPLPGIAHDGMGYRQISGISHSVCTNYDVPSSAADRRNQVG